MSDPTPFEREIMDGYRDGRADDRIEFPKHSNRSEAYRHGWLNGRDDRIHRPRASAVTIGAQADLIERALSEDEAKARRSAALDELGRLDGELL